MKTNKVITILLFLLGVTGLKAQNTNIDAYVKKMVVDPDVENATFGISVYNVTKNKPIYNYNGNKSMIPASIQKLITTSIGFEKLGKDFRFKTSIGYTGTIDEESGVLYGNIYIIGGGDPILGSYRYKQTAIDSVFSKWKQAMTDAGIKKVEKRICYDASIFDSKQLHDSWMWGDIGNYYGCGVSGLNIHENMYFAHFSSGSLLNRPAIINSITPRNVDVWNKNEVTTGSQNSGDGVVIYGEPNSNVRSYTGTVPLGQKNFKIRGSIPNPPETCAKMFQKYLNDAGIETSAYVSESSLNNDHVKVLFDYFSPSYLDIVTFTNHTSNNIYVESIFKYLGYNRYKKGSFETGEYVVKDFFKEHQLVDKGVSVIDGSGLSRQNMMTTSFMCKFLAEISRQPYFNDFLHTLPQIGKSGTAKNILKNKNITKEIYIKTGSMSKIKAYAGYVVNDNGDLISFCFIANNFECSQSKIGTKLEQILLMIID